MGFREADSNVISMPQDYDVMCAFQKSSSRLLGLFRVFMRKMIVLKLWFMLRPYLSCPKPYT